jgi:tRNA-2-methylthio-N6-dimethylallyladenosine synthase
MYTIGCQMNVYDSDQIVKGLKSIEYETATSMDRADLIILNTCAIREKAQQKAYSFLGRLAKLKRKKPDLIIGVGGCVAQQQGEKILTQMPHLDFVFGTHAIGRLPGIIRRVASQRSRVVDVEMSVDIAEFESKFRLMESSKPTRFVTIMRGCDNYCAYCVVPYVRGQEVSRDSKKIIQEIRALVASGVREVTLLGQNVNSYGLKEGLCSFPKLLEKVNDIKGIQRIRFTTSHPKDLSEELMRAFAELEKLCNHIHLPVQSGSNRILKRMNRKYTREGYLEKVALLRHHRPDIAVTSDFIVGFPGETTDDFDKTLDMIRRVQYDGIFAFKYSDRPSAPSVHMPDKVTEPEKRYRLQELLRVQEQIAIQKNQTLVNTTQEILVDGLSRNKREVNSSGLLQVQWTGRTTTNKIVNFSREKDNGSGNDDYIGTMVQLKIKKAFPHSLWGRPVYLEPEALDLKGEGYAA